MSSAEEFRRLLPPPRRRPGLLTILVRWRIEVALTAVAAVGWWYLGSRTLLLVLAALVGLAFGVPSLRTGSTRLLLAIVIPHRVRSSLIQAGVTDRAGRPPWVIGARARGDTIEVSVWLRSGTTQEDLSAATNVIGSACGAADVKVVYFGDRQDRAVVIVYRPRWGWPGR